MLFGKTLVITGIASGIGARTAELAGQLGADVVGIDRRVPEHFAGDFIKGDLGSSAGIAEIVGRLPERFDALVNVAGLSGEAGSAATLAVNFYGLRALTEALAPHLREGGSVVNVASIAGYGWRANLDRARTLVGIAGFPDVAKVVADKGISDEIGYPLSKELLLLWTMKAAHDPHFRQRGIRVNAVSPGPVETPILGEFRAVLGESRVQRDIDAVGRAGTASDVAPAILFLTSDGARWVNGVNLPADGGLEAAVNAKELDF